MRLPTPCGGLDRFIRAYERRLSGAAEAYPLRRMAAGRTSWRNAICFAVRPTRVCNASRFEMNPLYQFGDFVLRSGTRELLHAGEVHLLPPKMFECLRYLIEHRERAVGRDELLAAVWGQVDADPNVVAQVIARLRKLVDARGGESLVRTVPHFGYH